MGIFFGYRDEDEDEDSGSLAFRSFREPSLKERYRQLTGDSSEGLSKSEMIERLENNIEQGFESMRVLGEMASLKSEMANG